MPRLDLSIVWPMASAKAVQLSVERKRSVNSCCETPRWDGRATELKLQVECVTLAREIPLELALRRHERARLMDSEFPVEFPVEGPAPL